MIYATAPVGMLIGRFEVEGIETGSPSALWNRFRTVGAISRRHFRDYFRGANRGYAIQVGEVVALKHPRPLRVLGHDLVPPQSFRYLPNATIEHLDTA